MFVNRMHFLNIFKAVVHSPLCEYCRAYTNVKKKKKGTVTNNAAYCLGSQQCASGITMVTSGS